jgi:YD repeat-containing protein
LSSKDFLLNGKVKLLESISYKPILKDDSLIFKEYTRGIGQNIIVTFDSLGNVISEKRWQKTSYLDRDTNTFRNYYDNKNRLIKRITNSSFERLYKYDFKGNLIEEKTFDDSLLFVTILSEFNKKGLKKREEIIRYKPIKFPIKIEANSKSVTKYKYKGGLLVSEKNKINKIKSKDLYYYDSNDRLIKKVDVVVLLGLPMKTSFRFYKYDAFDNLIEETISKKKNDGFHSKTTYSFNDSNLLIAKNNFGSSHSEPTSSDSLKYNNAGLLIEENSYSYGSLSNSTTYEYDIKGNIIIKAFKTPSNYTRTTKYKYDTMDNWILKEEYEKGVLKSIIKRQIEYY